MQFKKEGKYRKQYKRYINKKKFNVFVDGVLEEEKGKNGI